jgi:hypothetical protein
VLVKENPHFSNGFSGTGQAHPLSTFMKSDYPYCPKHPSMSYQADTWDYPGGWLKTYKVISEFYDDVKSIAASEFAQTFCGLVKNPPKCKEAAKTLAGVAINTGLTAAGLPPTLPDLDEIAKGKVVDVAVDYSCKVVESQGGTCTPEMRLLFTNGYKYGVDQLLKDNVKQAKEPYCGAFNGALPCFTDYPDVKIEPAKGAVFEPPSVTIRVTLIKPSHSWTNSETKLVASWFLHNVLPAGTRIENYYARIPETRLDGQLFLPVEVPVPFLGVGQSANLTLVFDRVKEFHFWTTRDEQGKATGYTQHNGWCHLYEGGYGSVTVSFLPNSFGNEAKRDTKLPKTWKCTFSP